MLRFSDYFYQLADPWQGGSLTHPKLSIAQFLFRATIFIMGYLTVHSLSYVFKFSATADNLSFLCTIITMVFDSVWEAVHLYKRKSYGVSSQLFKKYLGFSWFYNLNLCRPRHRVSVIPVSQLQSQLFHSLKYLIWNHKKNWKPIKRSHYPYFRFLITQKRFYCQHEQSVKINYQKYQLLLYLKSDFVHLSSFQLLVLLS